MMRSLLLVGIVAACITSTDANVTDTRRLQVMTRAGRVVWSAPVAKNERFDLSFIHSQEGGVWTQHYAATSGRHMRQVASTFPSFGAGMPVGDHTTTRWTAVGYVADSAHHFSTITFMHSHTARMTLHYRNQHISLSQWFRDYESFAVRVW